MIGCCHSCNQFWSKLLWNVTLHIVFKDPWVPFHLASTFDKIHRANKSCILFFVTGVLWLQVKTRAGETKKIEMEACCWLASPGPSQHNRQFNREWCHCSGGQNRGLPSPESNEQHDEKVLQWKCQLLEEADSTYFCYFRIF